MKNFGKSSCRLSLTMPTVGTESQKFSGHLYIGRTAWSSWHSTAFLFSVFLVHHIPKWNRLTTIMITNTWSTVSISYTYNTVRNPFRCDLNFCPPWMQQFYKKHAVYQRSNSLRNRSNKKVGMLNDYRIFDYRIKCSFSFSFISHSILEILH